MGVYDRLKEKTVDFGKPIKKESKILCESVYFKKLNASEWQVIDAMKTQLAHSIVNQKLTLEEASQSNYVFDLIKMSWIDKDGTLIISNDERFEGLSNGEIDSALVNELSKLALEANGFIKNLDDLKKK